MPCTEYTPASVTTIGLPLSYIQEPFRNAILTSLVKMKVKEVRKPWRHQVNYKSHATVPVQLTYDAYRFTKDHLPDLLKRINCPVFGLWSEQDGFVHPRSCAIAKELMPHAECRILTGVHHKDLMTGEQREILFSDILRFLAKHSRLTDMSTHHHTASDARTTLGVRRALEVDTRSRAWLTEPLRRVVKVTKSLKPREDGTKSLVDKLFPRLHTVRSNNRRHQSMDAMYLWEAGKVPGLKGKVQDKIFTLRNAQGIRNRYRLVVGLLESEILRRTYDGKTKVKILSVACGSGKPVLDACAGFPDHIGMLTLFDNDATAAESCAETARKLNLEASTVVGDALELTKHKEALAGHSIIEMVGLIDYVDDKTAHRIFRELHDLLPDDGVVITSHVHPNEETAFVSEVASWDSTMRYRTEQEFKVLLRACGYSHIEFITEPQGIHTVAVLEK